jgi:AbrB family looped-hinge helix DNA binding protein
MHEELFYAATRVRGSRHPGRRVISRAIRKMADRSGWICSILPDPAWCQKPDKKEPKMANRLTIKGQVTIPKEVRDFLHLTNGDSAVEFVISPDGSVSLRKAEAEAAVPSSDRSRSKNGRRVGVDVLSLLSGVCI